MKTFQWTIRGINISGRSLSIVIGNQVLFSQWDMKNFRQKKKGYKTVEQC